MVSLGIEGFDYRTVQVGRSTYSVGLAGFRYSIESGAVDAAAVDAEPLARYVRATASLTRFLAPS